MAAAAALSSHNLFAIVIVFLVGSLNLNPTISIFWVDGAATQLGQSNKPPDVALFIFGDSLYDPGNNNYINTTTDFLANFSPYGETFFNYPTGRFSDGRLIPDFIAEYAKLPIIPPYLQSGDHHHFVYGANFASGGGGALDETYAGLVINLKTQMTYFKQVKKQLKQKLGSQEAKQLLFNSVYLVSIGGNDYLSTYGTSSTVFDIYTPEEYVEIVIGNITSFINEMYNEGARKFGFFSLPPLGCWPSVREANGDCVENVTSLMQLHNKEFSRSINKLDRHLEGFTYSKFDLYTSISDRMNNPSKYGLEEGMTACCGSGPHGGVYSCGGKRGIEEYTLCEDVSEYLFFDSNHPTETVYQQLAMLMWSGNPPLTSPNNVKALFEVAQLRQI
ncbi:hypothetical protein LguiA_010085 [Lonicera macranthoides]